MATDFELTRNEIVRAAYEDCRVAIDGEELSAEQLTKGIKKLNAILKHLQAHVETGRGLVICEKRQSGI